MTHGRMLTGIKIGALIGITVGVAVALYHVSDCPPLAEGCAAYAWGTITTYAMLGATIGGVIGLVGQWRVR